MSRRHEQDQIGGWKTATALLLGFVAFLGVFLLPDIYPLATRRIWITATEHGRVATFGLLDMIPVWLVAVVIYGTIALVVGGLGIAVFQQLRRRFA